MSKGMARERLTTRNFNRDTLKVPTDGRFNTRVSKIARVMRNDGIRIHRNFFKATIP